MKLSKGYESTGSIGIMVERPQLTPVQRECVRKLIHQGYTLPEIIADQRHLDPVLIAQAVPIWYFIGVRNRFYEARDKGKDDVCKVILDELSVSKYTRSYLPDQYAEQLSLLEFTFS